MVDHGLGLPCIPFSVLSTFKTHRLTHVGEGNDVFYSRLAEKKRPMHLVAHSNPLALLLGHGKSICWVQQLVFFFGGACKILYKYHKIYTVFNPTISMYQPEILSNFAIKIVIVVGSKEEKEI